ncbi:MAG TPA: hypothetical protein VFF73_38100 [Planctomycetota bacterium]|nr:hypothetical protein [Planctomycetota bacterium]
MLARPETGLRDADEPPAVLLEQRSRIEPEPGKTRDFKIPSRPGTSCTQRRPRRASQITSSVCTATTTYSWTPPAR